jgi:predicted ABC-type ATPase
VPRLIIIAGPNGAGKTTFAREYLSAEEAKFEFVNADEIARSLSSQEHKGRALDIQAGRLMLACIDELVGAGANFVIETTLASLMYARKIPQWRALGYEISLVYVRLGSVEESAARVRRRVEAGGHGIPEDALRRRFAKSADYFETIYKPLADSWYLWESREGGFVMVDSREGR